MLPIWSLEFTISYGTPALQNENFLYAYQMSYFLNIQTKVLPAKYIMKTDDDAFVRIDEVLSSLKGKAVNGLLYGLISFESAPHRDKDSKWYISTEVSIFIKFIFYMNYIVLFYLKFDNPLSLKEWPHASYPPWAHGPGYIISRDIAKFIVRGHQERGLKVKFN